MPASPTASARPNSPEPILFCWSGGKDSCLALDALQQAGDYHIAGLVTTVTKDYDRISMHGVRRELLHQQAESVGINLTEVFISAGATNDEYETQMTQTLTKLRDQGFHKIAFGDIFLGDLRQYREQQMAKLQLEAIFPIWKQDTTLLIRRFISKGFRAVTTCVDPRCLGREFVGRIVNDEFLDELPASADPCGENGEFHTFVFDGPIFKHPVSFSIGEKVTRDSFFFCDLVSV